MNRECDKLGNDDVAMEYSIDDILNGTNNVDSEKEVIHEERNMYDDYGGHMYEEMNFYSMEIEIS